MQIYQNSREFRLKMLALMLDNAWMARYGGGIIQSNYFDMEDEEAFAGAVLEYRERYGRSPKDPVDVAEMTAGKHVVMIQDVFDGLSEWDLQLAEDFALTFAKQQAARLAILDSVDDVQNDNVQAAIDRMKVALSVGERLDIPGIDPIDDIDKWLYDYWVDKVPTGLMDVDRVLEGGLGGGELGIVLAPQNRGKSTTLINIGYGAAGIMSGRNVIHFVHEMSEKQTAKRYAARLTFRFPKRGDDLDEYADEVIASARRLLKGKIRIIGNDNEDGAPGAGGKTTTGDIEHYVNRMIAEGFEPGLIIDDYPDLIAPPAKYNDKRFELSAIYEWYRDYARTLGVPVWGASQANREAYNKEIITLDSIAEDIGKASIADVIMALCQTYDEKQLEICRLVMAKVRDGASMDIFKAKYYPAQQAIITMGKVEYKEKQQDV